MIRDVLAKVAPSASGLLIEALAEALRRPIAPEHRENLADWLAARAVEVEQDTARRAGDLRRLSEFVRAGHREWPPPE